MERILPVLDAKGIQKIMASPKKAAREEEGPPAASTNTNWVFRTRPPLFWEPISANPLSVKLAKMTAALDAGADPNEMDHESDPRRSMGRPLENLALEALYPFWTRIRKQ